MVDGDYFRHRAAEVRSRADLATDPAIRNELLKLAAEYHRLAEQADKLQDIPASHPSPSA